MYPIKTLDTNTQGRDFVIGDLHGSYSVFKNLLRSIKFNPEVDRIISVGDLVDRGPDSLACLSLLRKPWFHSVLANHEYMMLTGAENIGNSYQWTLNGGAWGTDLVVENNKAKDGTHILSDDAYEFGELLKLVKELPYIITVSTKSGKKFHIIHAELPVVETITDELLADPVWVYREANKYSKDGGSFLWSRLIFGMFSDTNLQNVSKVKRTIKTRNIQWVFNPNLSHVISGHTILKKPITIWGQTCIDTSAYYSYTKIVKGKHGENHIPKGWEGLTCVELDSWKFYRATPDNFLEVEPVVITESDILG